MALGGIVKFGVIVIAIIALGAVIAAANRPATPEPTPLPSYSPRAVRATVEPTASVEPTPPAKEISYTVLKRGSLETGAGGIVIPVEYLNDADMAALGEELKQDYASDRTVNVRVFTDNRAYALYDKVIAEQATPQEDALYTKNFVGWYKKNGSNGYHEFDTFIGGVLGEHKTLTY
ncbi:MAG: hypothetical protein WEA04_03150 [Candidatus Andersenbacteria bacterium]